MKFISYLNNFKYYFLFLIIGLFIFFNKALFSGFDLFQGGYENLYFNYILEHSFLWVKGLHSSFWFAPFNYYDPNSVAQADSLFAICPIYWFIRMIIKNPLSSFQVLFFILCFLNYTSFYIFLKQFKLSSLACALGSYIFAFSLLRYFHFDNISSFTQFLSIISIILFLKTSEKNKNIVNHCYYLAASIFIILQFYTSFSLGFFFVFCIFFALLFSFIPKNSRDITIGYIKKFYKLILFYCLVIFLSLLPMAYHYSCVGNVVSLSSILSKISNYEVWFRSLSVLDNFLYSNYTYVADGAHLSSMSFGIFTTICAIYSFFRVPTVKGVSLLTLLFIFLISSGYSALYFWRIFYYFSFGIESIESINGISFIALIIIAIGCSLFVQNEKNKIFLILFLLVVVIEQIPHNKDINSSYKNYFISKSIFINSVNKIKTNNNYINIRYIAKNDKELGKNDIELKNRTAQKIADLNALWLGIKLNKPVINNYPHKSKPQKPYNDKFIDLTVDYNQI